MLTRLFISNYILIDEQTAEFGSGFNVITGETGAGKSIILGAINLLLGARAEGNPAKHPDQKTVLEAHFNGLNEGIKQWLLTEEIDVQEPLILRREILPSGKSRAFINDTPVLLQQMGTLGDMLVDIHMQGHAYQLMQTAAQTRAIDQYCGNEADFKAYTKAFQALAKLQKELDAITHGEAERVKALDYLQFQLDEINALQLEEFNLDEAESQLNIYENAERIIQSLSAANGIFEDEENSPALALNGLKQALQPIAKYNTRYQALLDRLIPLQIELDDLAQEVAQLQTEVEYDDEEYQILVQKFDAINRLTFKHGLDHGNELLTLKQQLIDELQKLEGASQNKLTIENEIAKAHANCMQLAKLIDEKRSKNLGKIEKELQALLSELGLKQALVKLTQQPTTGLSWSGLSEVSISFKANKVGQFEQLKNAASGGELSRVMLAIKHCLARKSGVPVMILDEVDTGVSGDIAQKMGLLMKDLGREMQVIAITHSPQVAGAAEAHFRVEKIHLENDTQTHLKRLNREERIKELAKILSGSTVTEEAIANAKILLT